MADVDVLQDLIHVLDDKMTRRMDAQDLKLDAIHSETRKTNGNVIRHGGQIDALIEQDADKRLTALEAENTAAQAVATALLKRDAVTATKKRDRSTFLLGVIAVMVTVVASVPIWLPYIH